MTELLSSCDEARKRQRLREERKKVLKICVNKLQMIQDPESYLCRSVLINNTLKTIQQENRQYLRQRARLKRQKDRVEEEDEPEIKKKCFDEEEEDEENTNDALNLNDIKSPLSSSYYDVDSYSTDVMEDVVFSDNIDNATVDVVSEDEHCHSTISASMNISISPVVREESDDKDDLSEEEFSNNNESCRTSNKHQSDKFTDSVIHNKSIESC